jgi:hypothetical protein
MNNTDLIGVFYNDEYLLKITKRYIQLSTNIGTHHKPFYSNILWREKYDFIKLEEYFQLSENILLISTGNNMQNIKITILDDNITISLTRFTR